ncbi:MAG: hypothetical protein ACQXXH_02215 [Candidatus Bathyarchaeia archaeon]|nr:hypothetical protein [Candidatus Bathyarchaeota archaeon A05DMB-4]MDH7594559.1 hypothetical protein [Candidatus Bathyarchaeota archaeon]
MERLKNGTHQNSEAFKEGLCLRQSVAVALVAVFGALHTVLSMFPGPVGFRSWIILIVPLEGIILGPVLGFSAGFIGYFLGWFIRPRPEPMFFGLGEPVGALGAGLIAQRKWLHALLLYGMMLLGFFAYPLTASLPLWALWDIYIAFVCIFLFALLSRRMKMTATSVQNLPALLGFAAFIGTEADVLARIFMLVPLNGYQRWGVPAYVLPDIFVLGAFQTPVEAVISVIATIIIGVPLVKTLQRNKMLNSTTAVS